MRLIAEMCQNHNGDFDTLKKMIAEAAEGGANYVKMQTIFADDLSFREDFEDGKTNADGKVEVIKRPYQAEYDRLKKLELSYEEHVKFIDECKKYNLTPLTTAFNITSVRHLKELGWESVKVASYDCGSLALIKVLSKEFKEIIVSTGASYNSEIERTAEYLNKEGVDFSLLHCVTIYPTPLNEMHLNRMSYLKTLCKNVGLSEHSLTSRDGVKACLAAIYQGATVLERHFTILPEEETRDGKVSIRKEHLKEIVEFSKLSRSDQELYLQEKVPKFEVMLGDEQRELSDAELLNRAYYRGRFCNKIDGQQIYNWDENYNWEL